MEVGVVGKPNVGKSTFFRAATLADAEIANFPFTTVKANVGVAYVRTQDPGGELGVESQPRNSLVRGGFRFTPVKLIDVAGLVPGAAKGKGLGNQFLDDLRQADVLIHVVDISGTTNETGEPSEGHDPEADIRFLADEIDAWFAAIIARNWARIKNRVLLEGCDVVKELAEMLAGLGLAEAHVKAAMKKCSFADINKPADEEIARLARELRRVGKPIVIAANKVDRDAAGNYERLKDRYRMVSCCAEAELALRKADAAGIVDYVAGEGSFSVTADVDDTHGKALGFIREQVLSFHGSTGVQQALNAAVFSELGYLVAYPVENENKYADGKGSVLPDSHLLPSGSTAHDLAGKIHSSIAERFIGAVDCKTKRKVGRDHELADGDVVKILTSRG